MAARCKLPFALRPGLSQERVEIRKVRKVQKKEHKESATRPLVLACRHHERGCGEEQGAFLHGAQLVHGAQRLRLCLSLLLPLLTLTELPFRHLTRGVAFFLQQRHQPSHVRCRPAGLGPGVTSSGVVRRCRSICSKFQSRLAHELDRRIGRFSLSCFQ